MKRHLVIFARLPRLGTGKKRLASGIGRLGALQFQQDNFMRLLRKVAHDPRWQTTVAMTPQTSGIRLPDSVSVISQPCGDLGLRMGRVMRTMPHGPVLIIGSDIPGIRGEDIAAAFRALGNHDAVFGPAKDGGYWAVGLRRRPHFIDPFNNVRWSTHHALNDTMANLNGYRVAMLRTLRDVDTVADLQLIHYQRGRL